MNKKMIGFGILLGLFGASIAAQAQQSNMSFFVTSTNSGKGANYGGLAGADQHCQTLAAAAGAGGKTWRAYLSASAVGGSPAVNAKDRIGKGPWQNAKGVVIAKDVAELHGTNNLTKQTALTEKGDRGEWPRRHAEPARHPDRHAARRHGVRGERRQDLRQLDEERRRLGDRRPPRSDRTRHEPAGAVVEFVASIDRLQRRRAEADRRGGLFVLLRRQLRLPPPHDDAPESRGVFVGADVRRTVR